MYAAVSTVLQFVGSSLLVLGLWLFLRALFGVRRGGDR